VEGDHPDHRPVLAHDRHREERLELLLLELGHELVAWIGDRVLGERRLVPLGGPPGEALAPLEDDSADELRVGRRSRLEYEPVVVLDEVDEAGVDGARVREEADDRAENLFQVERGPDRRDDLVQDPALGGVGRTRFDGRIVRRKRGRFADY
jgi:hypothetical protein